MLVELIDKESSPLSLDFLSQSVDFIEDQLCQKKILESKIEKVLNIVFVTPLSMKDLNRTYLKKDYVTDVLSFAPTQENCLGELALCEQKITEQAKENNLAFEAEAFYLILHGILHLLGFHHEENEQEAQKMYQIQDSIFAEWEDKQNKSVTKNKN